MEKHEQDVLDIKDRLKKPADLVMNRVPKNTLKRFNEIANDDDYCSDRGMALKGLIDFHDGLIPNGFDAIEAEIVALRTELDALKGTLTPQSDADKIKKRLDGSGGKK